MVVRKGGSFPCVLLCLSISRPFPFFPVIPLVAIVGMTHSVSI